MQLQQELKKLLIPADEVMESCIQKELDTASKGKRVTFNGHLDAYPSIYLDYLSRVS